MDADGSCSCCVQPASLLVGKEAQDGTSDGEEPLLRLPSPEEKMHALSLEYPPVVVPIDTSESNFNRLSSVRRSLIHVSVCSFRFGSAQALYKIVK